MEYRIKEGFIINRIADKTIVVPVNDRLNDMRGMVVLSRSGEVLWGYLKDWMTVETLTDKLTQRYDVEKSTAFSDVNEFISKLKNFNVLEIR